MTVYDQMRHFADTWGLLGMKIFFVLVLIRVVFGRGMRRMSEDAAAIPFKEYGPFKEHGNEDR